MSSKNLRNAIAALVILAAGVRILLYVPSLFVNIEQAGELGKSFSGIGDAIFLLLAALALLLLPFYLSARSGEKKRNR